MNETEVRNTLADNSEERVNGQKLKNSIKPEAYPILEYDSNKQSVTVVKTDIYPKHRQIKR